MKPKLFSLLLYTGVFILSVQICNAQGAFFSKIEPNSNQYFSNSADSNHLKSYLAYHLDEEGLRKYLLPAPLEFSNKQAKGIQLNVPLPNGQVEPFELYESPILSLEVAKKHPEIKTYAGKGVVHKNFNIRINFTSEGFSAIILGVNGDAVFFEQLNKNVKNQLYKSYFFKNAIPYNGKKTENNKCGAFINENYNFKHFLNTINGNSAEKNVTNGEVLKTFRLAMPADAEFTAQKGGTQASAFAAITNYVNMLNAVYRHELSVAFTLVSDQSLVYTNAATDPYNNNDQSAMLSENQTNVDNTLGSANYDVGHVLGYAGGSGGGLASTPSVCQDGYKAQGTSGVGDGSYPVVFDFQLIAHEIGHQFSMTHSYNSNVPVCTTRELSSSVEPGSGTTIMSYGYTCSNSNPADGLVGDDDYEFPEYEPILYFHYVNLQEALNYIATLSCFSSTSTGDAAPVIDPMATSYTIPKSTPFSLVGTATDADAGDDLSYSWEGTNISNDPNDADLTATTISNTAKAPFFRSYSPVLTSASANPGLRYYPRLSAILDGSNYAKGDKLPSIGIATTHTLTVRDNKSGIATKDVTVNVDGNSGPFLITNDPAGSYNSGSTLPVTWSVNNTNAAPINCSLVDIFISTDGGQTFPTKIGNALPNSGIASVTLPISSTSQARIKVAPSTSTASGNLPGIFFDISNNNFTINSITPVTWLSFKATLKNKNDVLLIWATAQEINNQGFDIEVSRDAVTYTKIGYEKGVGNSTITSNYQYPVNGLVNGIYYFRLKQLNLDGSYKYSSVVTIVVSDAGKSVFVFPNPTNDVAKINLSQYANKSIGIKIIDMTGRNIWTLPAKKYTSLVELNTEGLAKGVYQIILTGNGFSESLKLIKL